MPRRGCRPRVPNCPPLSRRGTPASPRLPARSRDLALHLASRKGVPASPLRFDPGTPFLDQHITDVYGKARCRVVSRSERAAGRIESRTTTKRAPIWTSSYTVGCKTEDCRGGEGDEARGSWVSRQTAQGDRVCRTASVYRQGRRSVYSRIEGSGVSVALVAVGSLVLAIHSVEASVAPVRRRRARWNLFGANRLAPPARCAAF